MFIRLQAERLSTDTNFRDHKRYVHVNHCYSLTFIYVVATKGAVLFVKLKFVTLKFLVIVSYWTAWRANGHTAAEVRSRTDNWTVFSSKSCGSRWARVVFVRRLMEWRFFHFWYQPSEALKSRSLHNSFAFSRRITKDKRERLFDLFWQLEKLANQKRSFPRFV